MALSMGLLGAALYVPQGLVLYDNGDENTAVTGGWITGRTYNVNGSFTRTKESDHLYLQGFIGGTYRHVIIDWVTSNTIDFSQYNSIEVDVLTTRINNNGNTTLAIMNDTDGGVFEIFSPIEAPTRQTLTLDISSINEQKRLSVYLNTGYLSAPADVSISVYKIQLFE